LRREVSGGVPGGEIRSALLTEIAAGAGVLSGCNLAVCAIVLPAAFGARGYLRGMHTCRTILQLPARIELKIMSYAREVEVFTHQLLNEAKAHKVGLSVEPPPASSHRRHKPISLPDAEGLRVNPKEFRNDPDGKDSRFQQFVTCLRRNSSAGFARVSIDGIQC
jgi:hypothetical protein